MKKPFRWNIEKKNELGKLIFNSIKEIDEEFLSELIESTSRIIAYSNNSRLFFVGRSPENYFDFLKGIYFDTKLKSDSINLFQFSGRFFNHNQENVPDLKKYITNIDLSPEAILKSDRNTALVDLVYTGSTMINLVSLFRKWAIEEKKDWNGVKRKLKIVGITERTKNSPNTWRWQQQSNSVGVLEGIQVKNVSVTWPFWSELGNNQSKTTSPYSLEKWGNEETTKPEIDGYHLQGLNFAYSLNSLGRTKEIKTKLKAELQMHDEMKMKWFKEWYNAI